MMKWFDPYKNESKYIKGKDKILHKCAWDPLPPISFGEMELFLTDIAGMIKVEQSPYEVNIILQNQGRDHPGMQYICSYTFPDEKTRDKWALPNEINMNHDMDLEYKAQLEKYPDELYDLAPTTLKKLYVACTRSTNNLYFINQNFIR